MKPKGGRGKALPYEQTHVRVPLPIKGKVQSIIDDYRAYAFQKQENRNPEFIASEDLKTCLKLVNMFREQERITQVSFDKPTRDNRNLSRFFDWIEGLISEDAAE